MGLCYAGAVEAPRCHPASRRSLRYAGTGPPVTRRARLRVVGYQAAALPGFGVGAPPPALRRVRPRRGSRLRSARADELLRLAPDQDAPAPKLYGKPWKSIAGALLPELIGGSSLEAACGLPPAQPARLTANRTVAAIVRRVVALSGARKLDMDVWPFQTWEERIHMGCPGRWDKWAIAEKIIYRRAVIAVTCRRPPGHPSGAIGGIKARGETDVTARALTRPMCQPLPEDFSGDPGMRAVGFVVALRGRSAARRSASGTVTKAGTASYASLAPSADVAVFRAEPGGPDV
jgi:hypothetical protein